MGKRLTPEEREARIKAYEEAKAARKEERLAKRKARVEAYEKAKAERAKKKEFEKRGFKPVATKESGKVAQVSKFPIYKGKISVGDEVGFRWLGTARAGVVKNYSRERNYRIQSDDEAEAIQTTRGAGGFEEFYDILDTSENFTYPIRRKDILAKKINGKWHDSTN